MKYLKEYKQEWYKSGDCTEDQLNFTDDEGEEIYHWIENLKDIVEDAGFVTHLSSPYETRRSYKEINYVGHPNCPVFQIQKRPINGETNMLSGAGWFPKNVGDSKEIMEFFTKIEEVFPKYQLKISNNNSYITMMLVKKLEHIKNENFIFESIKKDDIKDITQSISDMGFDVKIGTSWTKPGYVPFVSDENEYIRDLESSTEKTGWNKTYTISMSKKSKSDELGLDFDSSSEVFAEAKVVSDRCSDLGKVYTSGYLQTDRYGKTFFKIELIVITSEKVGVSNKDAIVKILKSKKYKIFRDDERYLILQIQEGYNNTPPALVKSKDPNRGNSGHHKWDKGKWVFYDWHPKRAEVLKERRVKALEFTSKIKPLLSGFNVKYSYLTANNVSNDNDYTLLKISIPQTREK